MYNNRLKYSFWEMKGKAEYVDEWFLMKSPTPIAIIMFSYWLFVLILGRLWMKNRKPFEMRTTLLAYNSFQVLLSWKIFEQAFIILRKYGLFPSICPQESFDVTMEYSTGLHFFLMAKLTELLDTIFFVLRKKYSQVTFLHVYHHSITVLVTWVVLKLEPSVSNVTFLAAVNAVVHVIMYTYYGLSAFPSLAKYLWWKKYITKMQLVQFVLVTIHILISYKLSRCDVSRFLVATIVFHLILFYFLFRNFYKKTYKTSEKSKQVTSNESDPEKYNNKHKSENNKVKANGNFHNKNNVH